jgi:hypothetical protein
VCTIDKEEVTAGGVWVKLNLAESPYNRRDFVFYRMSVKATAENRSLMTLYRERLNLIQVKDQA